MKKSVLAFVLVPFLLAGCKSTAPERAEEAVASLEQLIQDLKDMNQKIDAVSKSLSTLISGKGADLKPPFDAFVEASEALDEQAEVVVAHTDDLRTNTQAYLDGWQKQMAEVKNPEIKAKAAERRKKASETFEEMRKELSSMRKHYETFDSDLHDIRTALGNELSADGLEALTPLIKKTGTQQAALVKKDVDHIRSVLDKIADTFDHKRSAPEPKPEGAADESQEPAKSE